MVLLDLALAHKKYWHRLEHLQHCHLPGIKPHNTPLSIVSVFHFRLDREGKTFEQVLHIFGCRQLSVALLSRYLLIVIYVIDI